MKILMVSPFPPLRDGVGKYAAQEVAGLRAEGHDVDILAPLPCAAHFVEDFKRSSVGLLKLWGYARRYDRVILQYQPAHFHGRGSGPSRIRTNFWMAVAFRMIRNLTVVCHEVEYPPEVWPRYRPEAVLERMAWKGAHAVDFHTTLEAEEMRERLGVEPKHITIRSHGQYFRPAVREDRTQARKRLEIDPNTKLFLCIGFIQPHKGFDRAVRAFKRVPGGAALVVVGSVRAETPEIRAHVRELADLAASDPRVVVRESMLSDEEFDRWIVASDVVVLPYREIWSSGVLERARVLDRPVIAARAGGMAEQIQEGDVLVSDDEELARAFADVVGAGPPVAPVAMSTGEAAAFVQEEAARRKDELRDAAGVERALKELDRSRGVHAVILPSQRRVIGPVLDLVKRVGRRALGWLLVPMLGQINEFEHQTLNAIKAAVAESRGNDPAAYALFDYEAFEKRFRGTSQTIKESQRVYVEEFTGRGPVVDVGSGRGEFLELLGEAGIEARGVDISLDMVSVARSKGLDAEHGDGIAYLRSVRANTLGGIFAAQVIEHMAPRTLLEFLAASLRALRPGGVIVCETINPQSLYALANWYLMDLTHAQPIHPNTLVFLAEELGFIDVEVRYLSESWPDRETLSAGDDAPEWAQQLAKSMDVAVEKIGNVVFGPQDYALVARVP